MTIGNIEGYDVTYSGESDIVQCKNIVVRAQKLIDGYDSGWDRVSLEKGVVLRKDELNFTIGCLKFTKDIGEKLINQIKNARSRKTEERLRQYAEA